MTRSSTRREFLAMTSLAMAGTVMTSRKLSAGIPVCLPLRSSLPASAFLRDFHASADLRALATQAIDAAKAAGATYADVRVSVQHILGTCKDYYWIDSRETYGVRALVDNGWGFAYGCEPSGDAIARCAQRAVSIARTTARATAILPTPVPGIGEVAEPEWTPPPVVTGEWRTPMKIDPFTVPLQQYEEFDRALEGMCIHSPDVGLLYDDKVWTTETRVFAATNGSLVTQEWHRAAVGQTLARYYENRINYWRIPELRAVSGGYEVLAIPNLAERAQAMTEQLNWLARLPRRPLDVGRYPIVLDGYMMGTVLGTLIGQSVELDRVLGYEAEASGGSRWTPELLGTPIASPLLTVTGNRALPSITAVQWDDDGVVPREHTVVKDGVLVDYHTSSQTVTALHSWYQQQGRPVQSNGCSMAADPSRAPAVRCPDLTMAHAPSQASLEDLCKDIKRGIVAMQFGDLGTDQQLSSASFAAGRFTPGCQLIEVERGKMVRRISGTSLQLTSPHFFKGLLALGDQTTVRQADVKTRKGIPWIEHLHGATAPAALFKAIDAIAGL